MVLALNKVRADEEFGSPASKHEHTGKTERKETVLYANYFCTYVETKPACLIYKQTNAVFKTHNPNWHFSTEYAKYASNLSCEQYANRASDVAL